MIKNGEYVIATNNAWTQTESTTCQVSGNEGVILLNPLMQANFPHEVLTLTGLIK